MRVREALAEGAFLLSGAGSDTPFLDASLLLAHAAGMPRDTLLARGPAALPPDVENSYRGFLARRAGGENAAYILGRKEFFGRSFLVDPRVLVPRPDTEILVEAALAIANRMIGEGGGRLRIHDAFTGSGCVGITLAAELPGAEVSLSDLSEDALAVAEANARALLGRPLRGIQSACLGAVPDGFDLIAANPPYVTRGETDRIEAAGLGAPSAREPRRALDGGLDGLYFYRLLVPEAGKRLVQDGALVVEIGEEQGPSVEDLFRSGGFREIEVLPDLAGRDRVVRGTRG